MGRFGRCGVIISTLLLFLVTLDAKNMDVPIVITFEGNRKIATSSLEGVVGAKRPSPIALWKDNRATINALYIPKLDEIFRLYYQKEGFYDANISHKIDVYGIHFFIKENKYIKVKDIEIKSDFYIDDLVQLRKKRRFRAELFSNTKSDIKNRLLESGFCNYDLETKAYIDLEKYSAKIEIELKKGSLCHFGKIDIDGSQSIDDEVVLSRLHFREGEIFDIEKIKESYNSLYALEAFDKVHIKENRSSKNLLTFEEIKKKYKSIYRTDSFDKVYEKIGKKRESTIPMSVKFREIEQKSHSRIGVGYATDLEFQAKYHWEYKNFYGGGRQLLFDILYSEKQKRIENNFLNPAFLMLWGYHMDFQNSAGYSEERNLHDYDEKVIYDKVYLLHRGDKWFHSIGIGIENRDISDDRSFFFIYPFMKLIYDLRDSKINPKNGFYFSHEMEYGLPYSPDSTTYLKYLEEIRAIYTLNSVTLSGIGRIGAIKIYDNRLPESKKFFAGGAFSNRAYGYDRIGITSSSTDTLENRGGYNIANLTLEANFPLYKSIHMGFFSDSTMISENQGVWEFTDRVIYSAGFGFRYMTPIGPFKIDFGFNVNKYSENAIHFQIGQSF
ncbi:BamA/TamA family outer membrane protein [Sulfurovum sp. bin170]|uniref:autotransporter assembly complex protein TamA n=1 Tax=Sulfurovum sp. bin170 TaxID=2695268 RepID=UPI0013E03D30|nr:BamA/TamA family outer membrane protein [Sulfurovum sp. bin170]NEW60749.1 BamA/TamA family outer membrane protein [Sulfurovum sp. bin170]